MPAEKPRQPPKIPMKDVVAFAASRHIPPAPVGVTITEYLLSTFAAGLVGGIAFVTGQETLSLGWAFGGAAAGIFASPFARDILQSMDAPCPRLPVYGLLIALGFCGGMAKGLDLEESRKALMLYNTFAPYPLLGEQAPQEQQKLLDMCISAGKGQLSVEKEWFDDRETGTITFTCPYPDNP